MPEKEKMIPFSNRKLRLATRKFNTLNEDFYAQLNQMGGERLWAAMAQAMEVGDRTAIRRIAGTYLQYPTHVPMGMSRDRIVLSAAAAHADYIDVVYVRDIVPFLEAVRSEIELVRLNDVVFGLRKSGSLDGPFERAYKRIEDTIDHAKQLVAGNRFVSAYLLQGLSFIGDFPLANALSHVMSDCGFSKEAPAVLSAQYRHLHSRPDLALVHTKDFLNEPVHSWNENSRCGALCDVGEFDAGLAHACRSLSVLPLGDSVEEMRSRLYSGRTVMRPLKALKYGKSYEWANAIVEINSAVPELKDSISAGYRSAIHAAKILTSLGLPQLAENLTVQISVISEPWVSAAVRSIGRTKVLGTLEEVDGRLRVVELVR
jgi:hypothetical protein